MKWGGKEEIRQTNRKSCKCFCCKR